MKGTRGQFGPGSIHLQAIQGAFTETGSTEQIGKGFGGTGGRDGFGRIGRQDRLGWLFDPLFG